METLPTKMLLATDGSRDAALAARAAGDLASRSGAELHVVHVWHSVPSTRFESFIRGQLHREAEELLAKQADSIRDAGGVVAEAHLREGSAIDEILDLAEEIGADLIVMGSRGHGPVERIVVGSVSEGVVHHARRPVLVVRGGEEAWPPRRIVVGDDGSDIARSAAEMGVGIGELLGANVLLVRAHQEHVQLEWLESLPHDEREVYEEAVEEGLRSEREALEARAAELEPLAGSAPKARVARGDAAKNLLEAAEENGAPSLVVVGARGLGFARRMLLGSVSTKILRAAVGPVLVCPYDRGTMSSQDASVG
jgi:nucleotide-binding universal stress UspA family protein